MSVEYLFRDWSAMPLIEKKNLALATGKTLMSAQDRQP
jgi:hypothetical protein